MGKSVKHSGRVALLTFTISLLISLLFQNSLTVWVSAIILFFVILTGIAFDIIGTAVTAAKEAPFHAMGADRVRGSKQAVYLIRHADQVANFCNDVVGDIAGTISGAIVAGMVLGLAPQARFLTENVLGAIAIAVVASLNVSGKSLGKSFAINQANQIVFFVGKFLSWVKFFNPSKKKKRSINNSSNRKAKRK